MQKTYAVSYERVVTYSSLNSARWIKARASFFNIKLPWVEKEKISFTFGIDGDITRDKLHAIRLDYSTFKSKIPPHLSHEGGKNFYHLGVFFIDNGTIKNINKLYNFLPPEDKIVLRAICYFLNDGLNTTTLIKSISNKSKYDQKSINFWNEKNINKHVSVIKNLGRKCVQNLGAPQITLLPREICNGIKLNIPTTLTNLLNIQKGLKRKAFYNGKIDG